MNGLVIIDMNNFAIVFLFHSSLENGHSTANRGLRQFRVEPIVKKATQAIIVHRRIWKQIASAT
ncbi:ATV_collapsed_G0010940.mRNA.1.CDS.1 [Saccharomyces cerevisiae]|nr:ATV_collapsed_G0010940.mRNA.1.CDS.1 [Saccharomyces cerevisiae]